MRCFLSTVLLLVIYNMSAQQNDKLTLKQTFDTEYRFLLENHYSSRGLDYRAIEPSTLDLLYQIVQSLDADGIEESARIRYLINAYNFLVIYQISEAYPLESVGQINDFFKRPHLLRKQSVTLNELEESIVVESGEPFTHLLLNCGAVSCPPLQYIDETTPLRTYYEQALASLEIIQTQEEGMAISKIFYWNASDFGSEETLMSELNTYGVEITEKQAFRYQDYDWALNDANALLSSNDYYPTQLYARGRGELKIFNNYYTQSDNGFRANFFSSIFQLLLGTNKNLNVGLDVKLRSVSQGAVSTFSALQFKNQKFGVQDGSTFFRTGISGIGPRIKYQPFKNKGNINFLHTVYFVPLSEAEGNANFGYSDYNNLQIFNQVFIEKELSAKSRLFFDLGLHFENIKLGVHRNEQHFTPIQLPFTGIYNYYATSKSTIYGLATFGQRVDVKFNRDTDTRGEYSVYGQIGAGAKYFLTDFLELELLYTNFLDTTPGRSAHTFNLGLRFFRI